MDPVSLEKALEKKCKNHFWLAWILFLTASPIVFNSAHLASYVFLGGNPTFFCNIPELVEANWTKEQIREISSPGLSKQSCVHYAWNYSLLKELDFNEALTYSNISQKPDVVKCKNYIYDEDVFHQTIVSEWDLVCDDLPLRSTAQSTIALGKFVGALVFGLISDRFGRKKTFAFSCIMYMIVGPSTAFVNSYGLFILFRLLIGVAGAGAYDTGYTILMELTVKNYRTYVGNIFNVAFSIGLIFLPLAAYFTNNWRQLQLAISVPICVLLIHCWFIPESPRWLITSGKIEKASHIIGSVERLEDSEPDQFSLSNSKGKSNSCRKNVFFIFEDYTKLFATLELTKRTLICYYLLSMGNLYYYTIALSGANFEVNQYLYIGLNGLVETPGFLLPLLFFAYFGRKSSGIALWTVSGIAMLVIIVIPQGWPIMCVTLVARLAGVAAYGAIMFYTLELFPTENRNTAMGSCVTMSQLGPLLAPYVVDILGKKVWWLPTTLCGSLALLGAFLLMFVPETRDTPMVDTIYEMKKVEKESLFKEPERAN
ncbi:organic cation transporter protein [Halyomorpha halys]|uniref:organic cation transporter protein n=1 Tax=Halyomorpha halys TaxID=286706 RepID=UPI0006D4D6D9|nr:organic cation transporter protein-like isoform X1 [Halyomorpha halys]XP_014271347.1 organic cation transporter protein-like isoform X1 [Halyomorpha halys]XP_014271348.1 organic cation transporter protein-like isoform X1 [Halyomorpha halys]XP_014271349.1 organic cation transporter protein-like isoform X1 [Halyomorpha halys]XP_014271350.1 organic cation transporter protein-like isoform X1 [Halyomorpha halys]XP_014271351.1 organic cation transporter protein-like isoform X1 [Halyomorpha halys]